MPSVAEVIVVCVGGCTGVVVAITETVFEPKLVTYKSLLVGLNAIPFGLNPTVIVFITESAQALSKPKKVLDNASAKTTKKVRINVQETACFFIIQTLFWYYANKEWDISYKMIDW